MTKALEKASSGAETGDKVAESRPRTVSISPASMTDSVADWPLHRVIEHLRQKEKADKDAIQPVRLHCRSTIKSLVDVIDSLAKRYDTSRNRLCRWMSYHAAYFAREDATITKLTGVQSLVRDLCLMDDDTDTLDIMNSLTPYAPRVVDENTAHLYLYDAWVASDFDDMARVCGVYRYRIVQVYLIKSILSGDSAQFGETANRLVSEAHRWDTWMQFRLGALETLVERKEK